MSDATINFYFKWVQVSPDKRQWKPSTPVLEPLDAMVVIEVPLKSEYIFNATPIMQAQLSGGGSTLSPILTPKGMRYCIDTFEAEMSEPEKAPVSSENVRWEDEPEPELFGTGETRSEQQSVNITWDDADFDTPEKETTKPPADEEEGVNWESVFDGED